MLIILTGKTASGKDTIKFKLLKKYPNLTKVMTTTSRSPRVNEKNGVDYNFLSRNEFERKMLSGDFAEYVEYGGNLYGTEKKELTKTLNKDLLWKIDPSRAGEVRDFFKRSFPFNIAQELIKKVLVIYITVPDEIVFQRLKNRGLPQSEIQQRMSDDKKIWQKYKDSYDFIVENISGKLDNTLDKVIKIIDHNEDP